MSEIKLPLFTRLIRQVMILFFRLLYHSFSWTYDLVAATVSNGRWQRWVLSAASQLSAMESGGRILELGYGPGHLQAYLQKESAQRPIAVFGLDESLQMARQASGRLKKLGLPPHLARGLAQALPYPSAVFTNVVATFPTPYIWDPSTLAEIQRVLIPGGRLVILMASWITGKSLIDRILSQLFRLTGEAPDENQELTKVLEPYLRAGFKASIRFSELPGSRLMFIIASKS